MALKNTLVAAVMCAIQTASAQSIQLDTDTQLKKALVLIERLANQVAAQDQRIQELEAERRGSGHGTGSHQAMVVPAMNHSSAPLSMAPAEAPAAVPAAPIQPAPPEPEPEGGSHDHMLQMPGGGPALKIRGFYDLNFGAGTNSNPLVFPIVTGGRSTFQTGEFDLFMSSKLTNKLSFVSELVIGSDKGNGWGLDIERVQLTYKASKYLEVSGGRFHTSIGYYNTAFHHGTWFQTAGGRPFMYYFEDSGGLLPVHGVGMTTTGLVPGTGSLGLHWIAEISNGHSADPTGPAVQNFASDKTSKAYNFATYIKPMWAQGLQIGGSYYRDRIFPAETGIRRVDQAISSGYVVYNNSVWEFLGEGVLLSNHLYGTNKSYNTPLSYGQISRKFGSFRPYVRYQFVNAIAGDPVNQFTGRYAGPSIGLRKDVTDYAAVKVQYNLLKQRLVPTANGLLVQMAFTF